MIRTSHASPISRLFVLVALLVATLGAPDAARAQNDTAWLEAKLVSYDEMLILYGLADALLQQGKPGGARAALLASTDGVRQALPKAHLPAVRTQLQAYEKLAPLAWKDIPPPADVDAFKALIAKHEAGLVGFSERVSLPPVGPHFKNPLDRVQRVLAAKEAIEDAKEAVTAYVETAPNVEAHLQLPEAQKTTAALRQIIFAAVSINGHVGLATTAAKEQAADLSAKVDTAVEGEVLSNITSNANAERQYGEYLKQLGETELGEKHIAHAEEAFEAERKIREARIAKNRVPKDGYNGGDAKKLKKLVKSEFLERFPKDTILAVRLAGGDFTEHQEWVKINDDYWSWRKIRSYQWAYVVFQSKDKKGDTTCQVYPVRIEQHWNGSGYGNLFTYRPAHIFGYTMLVENVEK